MYRYIQLEWKKLDSKNVLLEAWIYLLIMMVLPAFFIKQVLPEFGESYSSAMELNSYVQLGFVLFGGSLINHLFIEQYKNKTMGLSFSYPISRKTLFSAKILFIAAAVFIGSVLSFLLSGLTTCVIDFFYPIIDGQPTTADIMNYIGMTFTRSLINTIISFIPLFLFGIWKRAVVPMIICSIVSMQLPNFATFIHVHPETIITVLTILGGISIIASVLSADKIGE